MPAIRSTASVAAVARAARLRRAWSQQQAADSAGVSRRFVSMLESGVHRNAELWRVLALLDALGVELVVSQDETSSDPGLSSGREPKTAPFDLNQYLAQFRKGSDS